MAGLVPPDATAQSHKAVRDMCETCVLGTNYGMQAPSLALRTDNPHVLFTRGTKADRRQASEAYMSHLLDPCGLPPKMLRTTRLADLVNTIDPKLVAAAFGMKPEGAMIYLADHLDEARLPDQPA